MKFRSSFNINKIMILYDIIHNILIKNTNNSNKRTHFSLFIKIALEDILFSLSMRWYRLRRRTGVSSDRRRSMTLLTFLIIFTFFCILLVFYFKTFFATNFNRFYFKSEIRVPKLHYLTDNLNVSLFTFKLSVKLPFTVSVTVFVIPN